MSTDEARNFALEKLSGGYSQGASWSGSRMGIKLVLILGVIILICCATKGMTMMITTKPERPHCRDVSGILAHTKVVDGINVMMMITIRTHKLFKLSGKRHSLYAKNFFILKWKF